MDKKNFQEEVLRLINKNKVIIIGIDGSPEVLDLDRMIDGQSIEGLLNDLNRLPEKNITWVDNPKWVHEFAIQRVITRLKERFAIKDTVLKITNKELAQKEARIRELEDALREIKDTQGKVCKDYEICQHISCSSSYSSWAIADKALSEKSDKEDE